MNHPYGDGNTRTTVVFTIQSLSFFGDGRDVWRRFCCRRGVNGVSRDTNKLSHQKVTKNGNRKTPTD